MPEMLRGAFDYCPSCGVRFSNRSISWGRCQACQRMICAIDASTPEKQRAALKREAAEVKEGLARHWAEMTPGDRKELVRYAQDQRLMRPWHDLSPRERAELLRCASELTGWI